MELRLIYTRISLSRHHRYLRQLNEKSYLDIGHPDEWIAFTHGGNDALNFDSHQESKKEARRQMKGTKVEIMQTCDACNKNSMGIVNFEDAYGKYLTTIV